MRTCVRVRVRVRVRARACVRVCVHASEKTVMSLCQHAGHGALPPAVPVVPAVLAMSTTQGVVQVAVLAELLDHVGAILRTDNRPGLG